MQHNIIFNRRCVQFECVRLNYVQSNAYLSESNTVTEISLIWKALISFVFPVRLGQTGTLRRESSVILVIWWGLRTSRWGCRSGPKEPTWRWRWCGLTPLTWLQLPTTSWLTPVPSTHTTGLHWTHHWGPACGPSECCTTGTLWPRLAFSSHRLHTINISPSAKVRL